jgi:DNA-binding CsgD family transcriptional regulator
LLGDRQLDRNAGILINAALVHLFASAPCRFRQEDHHDLLTGSPAKPATSMDLTDSVYEALADEAGFLALPASLAAVVGARSATIQVLSKTGELQEMAVSHFTPDMFDFYVANEMWRHDIWRVSIERRRPRAGFVIVDETLSLDRLLASHFYNEFLQPFGDNTAHCMGTVLETNGGGSVAIGMHRPLGAEPFAPSDVKLVNSVLGHLTRVFGVREALSGANRLLQLTGAALDANPNAVFVVDATGRPLTMNVAAQALVKDASCLRVTAGGLRALHPSIDRALIAAIHAACMRSGVGGGSVGVPRATQPPLRLVVTPLQVAGITRALVVVNDPTRDDDERAQKLVAIYHLTRAEAEIAVALSGGLSPAGVASMRCVGLATIRTQIRHIFRKMEVHGIADLVALVVTLPGEG